MDLQSLILAYWPAIGIALLAVILCTLRERIRFNVPWMVIVEGPRATEQMRADTRNVPPEKRAQVPEKMRTYDETDLRRFIKAANSFSVDGKSGLEFYRNAVLRWDQWFAGALTATTMFFLYLPAWAWPACTLLQIGALYGSLMAVVYLAADVAEDSKLQTILADTNEIDRADVLAANMLTRIKMLSLALSVAGAVVFVVVLVLQSLREKILARRLAAELEKISIPQR